MSRRNYTRLEGPHVVTTRASADFAAQLHAPRRASRRNYARVGGSHGAITRASAHLTVRLRAPRRGSGFLHGDSDTTFVGGGDRVVVTGVDVPDDTHAGVVGEHPLDL